MIRPRKLVYFIVISLIFLFSFSSFSLAVSCEDSCDDRPDSEKPGCLADVKSACEAKLSETNAKKETLASAIEYLNSKIGLTQSEINEKTYQIQKLEDEILNLEGTISTLDLSLDQISKLLSEKIIRSYKNTRINPIYLLFGSDGFSDIISRYKYLKIAQTHNRNSIAELEIARANYDKQKTTKEQIQTQVLGLQTELLKEKQNFDYQQREKEQLLVVTQHEESRYQELLNKAIAQQQAFSRFITNQGGASILSNQTKCDGWGCYYNQRDSQWGNIGLGGSSYSVASYGCLVSSVSMVASHYGKSIKPSDIATTNSAFVPGQGYLYHSFSVNGINVSLSVASTSMLDSELAAGRPVIAGLYSGPDHFIVIVKKEGDKYIMHDPFMENGSNRDINDAYSISAISSLRLVSFN